MENTKPIVVVTNDFVTVYKAADQVKKPPMTLYRWIKAGKLLSMTMGGIVFIPKSEVSRLLREEDGVEVAKVAPIGVDDAKSNNR